MNVSVYVAVHSSAIHNSYGVTDTSRRRVLCHVENKVNPETGEKTRYKTYWVPAAASSALQRPSSDMLFK